MDPVSPAQAAPETPATAVATATDNAPSSQPEQVDLADASLEQLDTLYTTGKLDVGPGSGGGGKVSSEAAPAETPAPATPETPAKTEPETPAETPAAPETATPETPAVETPAAPTSEEEQEIAAIQRPRLKDKVDQQIAAVFKAAELAGNKISWAEAERRVKGEPETPAAPVAATPEVPETANVDTLRNEIAELEAQLEEKAGEEGVLYDKAIKDLSAQLSDKRTDLKLAERDLAQHQKAVNQSRKEARRTSQALAIKEFPSVADGESPLGKAVAAKIAALKAKDSPVLYDDEAPYLIALQEATRLGIAPVAPATATAATPSPAPAKPVTTPARKVVSPPSGAATAAPATTGNPQAEQAKTVEYLKKHAPLEELDNLFMPNGADKLLFAVAGR
jgi:hypothetical protein